CAHQPSHPRAILPLFSAARQPALLVRSVLRTRTMKSSSVPPPQSSRPWSVKLRLPSLSRGIMDLRVLPSLVLLCTASILTTSRASAGSGTPTLAQRFAAWRQPLSPTNAAPASTNWRMVADDETGFAQMIHGG